MNIYNNQVQANGHKGLFELFRNIVLFIGLIFFLFISPSTAYFLGIDNVDTAAASVLFLLVITTIFADGVRFFTHSKHEMYVLFVGGIILIYMSVANGVEGFKVAFFLSLFPFLVSVFLRGVSESSLDTIRKALLLFYMLECLLGIYERVFFINFFPANLNEDILNAASLLDDWQFRSTSLRGHPLANALTVSILSGFILVTTKLSAWNKATLLSVGMFSLICFNARGSLLIWSAILIVFATITFRRSIGHVVGILILVVPGVVAGYLFLSASSFGGRLFASEIMDGSAGTRLEVFRFLEFISFDDFLLGNTSNYIHVMNALGAGGVENSIIVLILRYGVVMTLLALIGYFFWIRAILARYVLFNKFVLVCSFVVLGMTNNGLAESFPWVLFVLCYHAFPCKERIRLQPEQAR
jgi:hypothetical protein